MSICHTFYKFCLKKQFKAFVISLQAFLNIKLRKDHLEALWNKRFKDQPAKFLNLNAFLSDKEPMKI